MEKFSRAALFLVSGISIGIIKAGLIALLFTFMYCGNAQSIIDTDIRTGYTAGYSLDQAEVYYDSLIFVSFSEKQANNSLKRKIEIYRASDLSLKKSFYLGNNNRSEFGLFSIKNIERGYVFDAEAYLDSAIFRLYRLNSDFSSINLISRKRYLYGYFVTNAGIIDNEVYVMLTTGGGSSDTTRLIVFDLSGNPIREVKEWLPTPISSFDSIIHSGYSIGPFQHPNKPGRIVYGNAFETRIVEIDKQTLELKYVMPRAPLNFTFGSTFIYNYHLYNDKIVCGGTAGYAPSLAANHVIQSYFDSRAWNGDSIERLSFGDIKVEERSYAFHSDPSTQTHFLGAAAPFFNFMVVGAEYRQIKIHRLNQFGADSIMIYGNKNHVPTTIMNTANGDLFVLSMYNNAWTNDSSFLTLTKIPSFAISLIEAKKVSSTVHMYPNPAHDYLMVSDLLGTPANIQVYDQQGKLHLQAEVEDSKISVKELKSGIYVVVVTTDDGGRYSSIVKKE